MLSKGMVSVIGLGVVGLPVALLLARQGYKVVGVDTNKQVLDNLGKGILPSHIDEKELQNLLKNYNVRKNLSFKDVPSKSDIFIITVPTPLLKNQKKADLSYVKNATESLVPFVSKGSLVIVESTIPPLTCKNFITPIFEKNKYKIGKDVFLAHCPERILPGNIYKEIIYNDRIIGGVDKKSADLAEKVYKSFVKGKLYKTDDISAELCKLMENSYRDVNIALANEFAGVAEKLAINPTEVIALANKHPRVNILKPSIGVGGHCIPIDPWFIYQVDAKNSKLIALARRINDSLPMKIVNIIKTEIKNITNPKIVIAGVAYKPDTTDIRESPAIKVANLLRKMHFNVTQYDPLINSYKVSKNLIDASVNKDILVILVPHTIIINDLLRNKKYIQKVLTTHKILQF